MDKVVTDEAKEKKRKQKEDDRLKKMKPKRKKGSKKRIIGRGRQLIPQPQQNGQPYERLRGKPKPPLMHNGPLQLVP